MGKIIVVGANGSIGQASAKILASQNREIEILSRNKEELEVNASELKCGYQVIDITNYEHVDKVIVVRSSKKAQIQRILSRNDFSINEIEARISNQMSLEEKIKYADFVLDNDMQPENLRQQVQELYPKLLMIAGN